MTRVLLTVVTLSFVASAFTAAPTSARTVAQDGYVPLQHECGSVDPSPAPCVSVSGRVVDINGNPVSGIWVEAIFTTDHYPEGETHPQAGSPILAGSTHVPRCYRTHREANAQSFSFAVRDAVLTDADGRYTLTGLYAGEEYWIRDVAADFDYTFHVPSYWTSVLSLYRCPFRPTVPYAGTGRAYYDAHTALPDFEVLRRSDHRVEIYKLPGYRWKKGKRPGRWVVEVPAYSVIADARFRDVRVRSWLGRHLWTEHTMGTGPTQGYLSEDDRGSGARIVSRRCGYGLFGGTWVRIRSARLRYDNGGSAFERTFPVNDSAC